MIKVEINCNDVVTIRQDHVLTQDACSSLESRANAVSSEAHRSCKQRRAKSKKSEKKNNLQADHCQKQLLKLKPALNRLLS